MTRVILAFWVLVLFHGAAVADNTPATTTFPPMVKMRALAGVWRGRVVSGPILGEETARLAYESVSGGQAVLERLKMGESEEMVSIYHQEGDQMMMTHYCSSNTQPRLRTNSIPRDVSELRFEFVDSTNIFKANWMNITWLKLEFLPSGVLRQTWKSNDPAEKPAIIEVRRER